MWCEKAQRDVRRTWAEGKRETDRDKRRPQRNGMRERSQKPPDFTQYDGGILQKRPIQSTLSTIQSLFFGVPQVVLQKASLRCAWMLQPSRSKILSRSVPQLEKHCADRHTFSQEILPIVTYRHSPKGGEPVKNSLNSSNFICARKAKSACM